jgi:hypothetical protein
MNFEGIGKVIEDVSVAFPIPVPNPAVYTPRLAGFRHNREINGLTHQFEEPLLTWV